jgi:hypothetical protein
VYVDALFGMQVTAFPHGFGSQTKPAQGKYEIFIFFNLI